MPVYKIENNKAKQLKTTNFKNEKELQGLIETNLEEIFGIRFIKTEHSTGEKHGGIIDTLGLDENNSPVIIEYKWGEKANVINQGLFYLDWLVDHKGDLQILVDNKLDKKVKIDWGQPRLLLVASSFNKYDKFAINRMAENIELWSYNFYENGLLAIDLEGSSTTRKLSGQKSKQITKVDYANFNLDYHLDKTSEKLRKIFGDLREQILELPDVEERAEQKTGVTYRTSKSFSRLEFNKNSIDLLLRQPKYHDPKKIVKDISNFEWGYKGLVKISGSEDINYLFSLIKQSYEETL